MKLLFSFLVLFFVSISTAFSGEYENYGWKVITNYDLSLKSIEDEIYIYGRYDEKDGVQIVRFYPSFDLVRDVVLKSFSKKLDFSSVKIDDAIRWVIVDSHDGGYEEITYDIYENIETKTAVMIINISDKYTVEKTEGEKGREKVEKGDGGN